MLYGSFFLLSLKYTLVLHYEHRDLVWGITVARKEKNKRDLLLMRDSFICVRFDSVYPGSATPEKR